MNNKVDAFIRSVPRWSVEFETMRSILLDCQLVEDFKWRHPCYTFDSGNIVIMQDFKQYCSLMFPKGALLKDPQGLLVAMTKNTQASRQLRFTTVDEILEGETTIRCFISEAIDVEKSGLKVEFKNTSEYEIPPELQSELDHDTAFRTAFENLTPGRQRGYLLHFSQPKRSETRSSRIEKCRSSIFDGLGLNGR